MLSAAPTWTSRPSGRTNLIIDRWAFTALFLTNFLSFWEAQLSMHLELFFF